MTFRSIVSRALGLMILGSQIAMISGCGDGPSMVPVSGTVTLDGKPLEGAALAFVPVAGNPISTGGADVTGPNGNFMMTYNGRTGLAPGKYKILISKTEEVVPKGKDISPIFAKASFEKKLIGLTKETIPTQKFEKEVEVPERGATDFALDFKSDSKKSKK